MTEKTSFNFPALPQSNVAPTLIENVVPALADAIHESAVIIAERECGEDATIFDVERIAGDLLYALADLLTLSPVPLRGVRDLLRFHQLDEVHAAAFFGVDAPAPFTVEPEETPAPPQRQRAVSPATSSGSTVHFADVASAAAALNLPPEVVADLGGETGTPAATAVKPATCARPGCRKASRTKSPYCSDNCRRAVWLEKREQGES